MWCFSFILCTTLQIFSVQTIVVCVIFQIEFNVFIFLTKYISCYFLSKCFTWPALDAVS